MRALLVAVLTVVATPAARADQQAAEDHAKADVVFEEAQKLKQAGKGEEACKKYDEALRYNRNAVGTLLNVGKCNEDAGKFATAVKHYTQARDLAREHSLNVHRTAAEERLAATAPRVPRLAIAFTERATNMKLVIDDEVYPTDVESTNELRLDPGPRHVVVTAPGRVPFETTVTLVEGKQQAVAIPKLGYPVTVKKARRTLGKVLTFSGLGLLVTGVAVGYVANRDYEREVGPPGSGKPCIQETPDSTPLCNPAGYQATGNARQLGTVGTVVGSAGLVAVGVGVVLWLTAPKEHEDRNVAIVPTVTPESAGVAAIGRF